MKKGRSNNFGGGSGKHDQDSNKKAIVKALSKNVSLNRRQLSLVCKIEICTLCLPLRDGVRFGHFKIAKYDYCPIKQTKRKVMYYALIKKGGSND